VDLPRFGSKQPSTPFTEERIQAEGQKDGERNIPEMGSYMPPPFEQALIAHGEQEVQQIYKQASVQIAKLQPVFQSFQKRLEDIERRIQPIADGYKARSQALGRDVTIPFPAVLHWGLIIFLGIGEFPLNTVVFRLFGEAEYLTYIMASTLAIMIPLIGVFIGIHLRHSVPRLAGNILIGVLTPVAVGAALYSVSLLRNTYIASQFSPEAAAAADQGTMALALFALNTLVFFGAMSASYFAHDPDEKLDLLHKSLASQDRKRNAIRKKLFEIGPRINGEIQATKSQVEQIRALTNQRVALYRQTNMRFRRLLPPPTFRKNPEFPKLEWWPEVSLNGENGALDGR
jgi:tetrahydromethanopterin S-methyltransferase subunit G